MIAKARVFLSLALLVGLWGCDSSEEAPAEETRIASVSAGEDHTCFLDTTGEAFCWGRNEHGQLGDGTNVTRAVPVAVAGGHTFTWIRAGDDSTCGLTVEGRAFCWGENGNGQFGNGTTSGSNVPVAASGDHTWQTIGTGDNHSCGLTTAGQAFCWGVNDRGQLGVGTTHGSSSLPLAVGGDRTFSQLSVGDQETCGLTAAGQAFCWGNNEYGQLGDGTTEDRTVPVLVAGDVSFARVSAGEDAVCGVTSAGEASCWGRNDEGELGNGTTSDSSVPVAVSGSLSFRTSVGGIKPGDDAACGVTTDDRAYCWGSNDAGQLGIGSTGGMRAAPSEVASGHAWQYVATGDEFACGLTTDSDVYCWGENGYGQLGDDTSTDSDVPVRVLLP